MKAFNKRKLSTMALTLAFLASVSIRCLYAIPAFADAPATSQPVVLTASAVAVADKFSADAAEQIFKEGGNAVDAAAAIAFTLAVTYPEAGNIGGGGFMTIYMNGKPYFLDYRERAPLAARQRDKAFAQTRPVAPPALTWANWSDTCSLNKRNVRRAQPLQLGLLLLSPYKFYCV